jgi:hypothetical protein
MAHDCKANTKHCFEPFQVPLQGSGTINHYVENAEPTICSVTNFRIVVRATVPIAAGEPITTCYTQPLSNTMARRAHLDFAKRFICSCARCKDPTEFGTYLTAWKCPSCPQFGKLVARDADDPDGEWHCET